VRLSDLTIDPEIQLRSRRTEPETVATYMNALLAGIELPPVTVFRDGKYLWLVDGFHRYRARQRLGQQAIEAEIHTGTKEEAMVFAATANVLNGRPMSHEQKREAGERLLRLTDWSQERIAKELAVAPSTVSTWKSTLQIRRVETVQTSDGRSMDVSNIGKPGTEPPPMKYVSPEPKAPLPESEPVTMVPTIEPHTEPPSECPPRQDLSGSLREYLAAYAHDAWSGWMRYLFGTGVEHKDGSFTIEAESVARWRRQMRTLYDDLPESEKESDRDEADKILDIVCKTFNTVQAASKLGAALQQGDVTLQEATKIVIRCANLDPETIDRSLYLYWRKRALRLIDSIGYVGGMPVYEEEYPDGTIVYALLRDL